MLTVWLVMGHAIITVPLEGLPLRPSPYNSYVLPQWYVVAWNTIDFTNIIFGYLSAYCVLLSTWGKWRVESMGKRSLGLLRKLCCTWCHYVPTLLLNDLVRAYLNPMLSVQRFESAAESFWGQAKVLSDQAVFNDLPNNALLLTRAFRTPGEPVPKSIFVDMFEVVVSCCLVVFVASALPRHFVIVGKHFASLRVLKPNKEYQSTLFNTIPAMNLGQYQHLGAVLLSLGPSLGPRPFRLQMKLTVRHSMAFFAAAVLWDGARAQLKRMRSAVVRGQLGMKMVLTPCCLSVAAWAVLCCRKKRLSHMLLGTSLLPLWEMWPDRVASRLVPW